MGQRSRNTTKSGKYMIPTDQEGKEARKQELKKNKKRRQLMRAAQLKSKDPQQLLEELEKIDQMEFNVYQPSPFNENVFKDKRNENVLKDKRNKLPVALIRISRFSGEASKEIIVKRGGRKRNENIVTQPIDFRIEFNEPPRNDESTTMYRNNIVSKVTLPPKCNIRAPNHLLSRTKIILTDNMNIKQELAQENQNEDFESSPYDYNDYCSQNNIDDGPFMEEEAVAGPAQAYNHDNLIDLPNLVPHTKIIYATQVNKMDMKLLKQKMWELITGGSQSVETIRPLNFSVLYKALPKNLNTSMRHELSSPLAFVALLHLTNEYNLKLVSHGTMADFTIDKDEKPHSSAATSNA